MTPDQSDGQYDWREQMRHNWEDHDRIWNTLNRVAERMDALARDDEKMHSHLAQQKGNIDNLLEALRKLLDRIPPESLR